MTSKRIHAAGMFGGAGKRKTWCGRLVDDDQLPIIGTNREINCVACARSQVAKSHARRWNYSYADRWGKLVKASPSPARQAEGGSTKPENANDHEQRTPRHERQRH